jgi:hypothetical protein
MPGRVHAVYAAVLPAAVAPTAAKESAQMTSGMPPIIGAAMRCMISEPVPELHMIGSRPDMMATTVIIFEQPE